MRIIWIGLGALAGFLVLGTFVGLTAVPLVDRACDPDLVQVGRCASEDSLEIFLFLAALSVGAIFGGLVTALFPARAIPLVKITLGAFVGAAAGGVAVLFLAMFLFALIPDLAIDAFWQLLQWASVLGLVGGAIVTHREFV